MHLIKKITQIKKEKRRQYVPPLSKQIFHTGIILLVSIIIGLVIFQFEPITTEPIKPENLALLRQGFGIYLGFILASISMFFYCLWIISRLQKSAKEANKEIVSLIQEQSKKE
jgi:formate-dependent nitrite reductase membrane component NrfD